ncbi:MAG: hypothetical protein KA479_03330 [Saprospiraceae bacterium]|nr:hypothetical protein [Saprospiraceae bacterium]
MAKTEYYSVRFFPDCVYHVYNRTVDRKSLFRNDNNYSFFLQRYKKYLSPLVETYSYALCGNHFHFGLKVKSENELNKFIDENRWQGRFNEAHALVSHQFQSFLLSYAKAFNMQHDRIGALFQSPFKRCAVDSEMRLMQMIYYHHANPQRHQLCNDFRTYPWTSYLTYLAPNSSLVPQNEVFEWIGGRQQFIEYHNQINQELEEDCHWMIED